jgi:glycosyltransferase involved in cell wall biosynthesis
MMLRNLDNQITFTIFTPTFNREHLLPRLYKSLCEQTYKDFEWLVVDDGSTDNTEILLKKYIAEADFPIRYISKSNGGKHTAINEGVRQAKGLFFQ